MKVEEPHENAIAISWAKLIYLRDGFVDFLYANKIQFMQEV